MSKLFNIIVIFSFLILAGASCTKTDPPKPAFNPDNLKPEIEKQIALTKADELFKQAQINKQDLSSGPCLANALYGNPDYPETMWVLDIAHEPRLPIDDLPENQCSAFREGQAEHFVELDPEGRLIKAE